MRKTASADRPSSAPYHDGATSIPRKIGSSVKPQPPCSAGRATDLMTALLDFVVVCGALVVMGKRSGFGDRDEWLASCSGEIMSDYLGFIRHFRAHPTVRKW